MTRKPTRTPCRPSAEQSPPKLPAVLRRASGQQGPTSSVSPDTHRYAMLDHNAPRRSVYKPALFTDCDMHFLLTKGVHNGGILSEPGHKRRHYRIGHRQAGEHYCDPDAWLAAHDPLPGSWWPEWARWLEVHSTGKVAARMPGSHAAYPAQEDAPGRYIHQI